MSLNILMVASLFSFFSGNAYKSGDPIDQIKEVATAFVEVVDKNDGEQLKAILHPDMVQFVRLDGKIIPFKAADYIKMVADKKLGGTPRTITIHSAQLHRGEIGTVELRAVSEAYDFMYQLSLVNIDGKWLITSAEADILKV